LTFVDVHDAASDSEGVDVAGRSEAAGLCVYHGCGEGEKDRNEQGAKGYFEGLASITRENERLR